MNHFSLPDRASAFLSGGVITRLVLSLVWLGVGPVWAAERTPTQPASFQYDSKGRRDPFTPLVREGKLVNVIPGTQLSVSRPVLFGILWDPGGQSLALLNDTEAKVGDMIGGYRVAEIRQDAVVLIDGGEPVVLQLVFETPPSKFSPRTTTGGEGQ